MFGLEKKEYKPFEFDLEKELKKDQKKIKQTRELADGKIQQLKNILRGGEKQENFENFGLLLQGYTALEKVLDTVEQHSK